MGLFFVIYSEKIIIMNCLSPQQSISFSTLAFSIIFLFFQISDRLAALSNLLKASDGQQVDPIECDTFDSCNVA